MVPSPPRLDEVLARYEVLDWDLLLVGDGSGNAWRTPSGYAVTLIDRLSHHRELLYGALSQLSVQLAELLPYLHALAWHAAVLAPPQKGVGFRSWNTHIFTDNANVRRWITDGGGPPLTLALEGFRQQGYVLRAHQVPRDDFELHILADHASRQARLGLAHLDLAVLVPGAPGLQLDAINP